MLLVMDRAGRASRRGPENMIDAQRRDDAKRQLYVGGRGGATPAIARKRTTARKRRGVRS